MGRYCSSLSMKCTMKPLATAVQLSILTAWGRSASRPRQQCSAAMNRAHMLTAHTMYTTYMV